MGMIVSGSVSPMVPPLRPIVAGVVRRRQAPSAARVPQPGQIVHGQ